MRYDPNDRESRRALARQLLTTVEKAGFTDITRGSGERVFGRDVLAKGEVISEGLRVVVWSSIVGDEVRELAEDAIRVAGVFLDGEHERGVVKARRVHRVGDVEGIGSRMLERMRDTWARCQQVERCRACGAPMFLTKKEKLVCARLCWLKGAKR